MICLRRILCWGLVLVFGVSANFAIAQRPEGLIPPRHDTESPTGVSLKSGAFSTSEVDLKIGPGEFPQSLVLERIYRSDTKPMPYDGLPQRGWSLNLWGALTVGEMPDLGIVLPRKQYLYSAILGSRSVAFRETDTVAGNYSGPFGSVEMRSSDTLEAIGGNVVMTDRAGNRLTYSSNSGPWLLSKMEAADGTTLTYTYSTGVIKSVFSNRGMAILFELSDGKIAKACAVNLAETYVTASSPCPSGAKSVAYSYQIPAYSSIPELTSVTNAMNGTTQYTYSGTGNLTCIKDPGQATCRISNTYSICTRPAGDTYDPADMHFYEQVISQATAGGETYSYNFPATRSCPPTANLGENITVTTGVGAYRVKTNSAGQPIEWQNEVGSIRTWEYGYANAFSEQTVLLVAHEPEGDEQQIGYDARRNIVEVRSVPKAGSGLANISQLAVYPTTCTDTTRKVCNQPTSVTDGRSNSTAYTYSPDHGGVLTKVGPADASGISPATKYTYAQRYSWIKNASGGYSQSSLPVWLLTEQRSCRSTAMDLAAGTCAGGAADLVVTTYEYGPNSGPNNLWLRGVVTAADAVSQRTCYGYDGDGRKVSETSPNANLASCS